MSMQKQFLITKNINGMIVKEDAPTTIPNVNCSTLGVIPSPAHPTTNTELLATQLPQNQPNPNLKSKANAPLKISSNFDRPTNTKNPQKPPAKNISPTIQFVKQASLAINLILQASNPSNKNKIVSSSPPPTPYGHPLLCHKVWS